jgi:protein CpxP
MQNMKPMRQTPFAALLAAVLAACSATSFAAGQAEPPHNAEPAGHGPDMRGFGPEGGPRHGAPGFDGRGPGGPGHGFGHFPGHLQLSEAQRDKLFAIHHAAAPQRRQNEKAVRRAHEALRALGDADRFDDAKAAAASRELGQAIAAQALLQEKVHAQTLAVLSPEQREQLRKRRPQPAQDRP